MRFISIFFVSLALTACPGPSPAVDGGGGGTGGGGGGAAGGSGGGSAVDAGPDSGTPDAGTPDAGTPDAGTPDAGPPDAGPFDAGPNVRCLPRADGIPDGGVLRVVAANLSSGNLQSWSPGHGQRILQGLKPDVTLIQEWNLTASSDADRRAWVDATFGAGFCFHVQTGGGIPNGVISRWPVLDAGQWVDPQVSNRAFAWVQLDVPGPRDLWAVSLHLLTSNPTDRNLEAQALVAALNQFVPVNALLVIGGDLNTNSRTEPGINTLGQLVKVTGPHPVDQSNNENTNAGRSQPYDWVLADTDLAALQVPVVVGDAGFVGGLVFDTRVYNPLSDVAPAQAGDSAAPSMQHMAVVKDFLLP